MNCEELALSFNRDGYLVFENFFEASLMDEMDAVIRGQFGDDPEFWHEEEFLSKSKTEVIPWFPQNPELPDHDQRKAVPFDRLEQNPRLASITRAVLGADWRALYSMVMFSRKGTVGQAWHQDCPPENPACYNLNRLVYTRDLTPEIGGQTVVMPGSHRMGELPVGEPHEHLEGQVVITPRKGMLLLLHGHTWHRVLPVTGACRFSTNFRSCPAGTPADITDICVYRNMRYSFSSNSVVEERQAN